MSEASGTKIIATVGPNSRDKRVLAEMVKAGVDGFRINCSHTRAGELRNLVGDIEAVGGGFTIADLAGRKLRCNHKLVAQAGETLVLGGTKNPFNNEIEGVKVGAAVWIGDGNLIGYVEHLEGDEISVRVERGGRDERRGSRTHRGGEPGWGLHR